jgi:hypothetical protein
MSSKPNVDPRALAWPHGSNHRAIQLFYERSISKAPNLPSFALVGATGTFYSRFDGVGGIGFSHNFDAHTALTTPEKTALFMEGQF